MNKLFRLLLLVVFIPPWLFSCGQSQTLWKSIKQPTRYAMLQPGDTLDTMTITTGANSAPPLWAFCSNSPEGKSSYILDCPVPVLATLGIGNIFLSDDEGIVGMDWSELIWSLSIDAQEVDLESFGTFDYGVPDVSEIPTPVREIFKRGTAWNIVLKDLKPGHHTLWFVAQGKTGSYTWFVNLDIDPAHTIPLLL